jgi:hyperosmotically inducible protein
MLKLLPLAAALASAFLFTGFAGARQPAAESPKSVPPKFAEMDKNSDGFLSKDEVGRDYLKAFAEADDNRDGRLDPNEFAKAEAIYDRQRVGSYVDDSLITAKVKAALVVETHKGTVLLSGFVKDETTKKRALEIAKSVSGVTAVKDGMALR